MTTSSSPFALALQDIPSQRFPAIRESLAASAQDPRDRDAFMLATPAVELLRDLRPEEGLGEAIDQLAAFLHHAYMHWADGERVDEVDDRQLTALLMAGPDGEASPGAAQYAVLPERVVWGEVIEGQAPEPLHGCSLHFQPDGGLRVLGIFGMHPNRAGFSVVEAAGPRAASLARADGSPLFGPRLAGGDVAGLHSIAGREELLELGWRLRVHLETQAVV